MAESELTKEVPISTNGRLNRAAVGWSRHPVQECSIEGRWPRKKRWHFWLVTSDTHLVALTFADVDYLGLAHVSFWKYDSKDAVSKGALRFGGWKRELPPGASRGPPFEVSSMGLRLSVAESPAGTKLAAWSKRLSLDIEVERPPGHETLNVLVPWSNRRFQFTSKQNCLPARGRVVVDGAEHRFGPENHAYGTLDFGRGVWPYKVSWNWATACGVEGSRVVGLNLGGKWTDGTGVTENGVVVDGKLTKIHTDVKFDYDRHDLMRPWSVRGEGVDLRFDPLKANPLRVPLGVVAVNNRQCYGRFNGRVAGVEVHDLMGSAEDFNARW
jgi:hypothetical protein